MRLIFTDQWANLILLLNGIIILLYIGAIRKNRQRAMKFGNFETLRKVEGDSLLRSHNIVLLIRLMAITILLLGISNPVIVEEAPSSDSDYVLALDSSGSMLAGDIDPNRFEASKELSSSFISDLPEATRIGVVSFSGNTETVQEMTSDKETAQESLRSLETGSQAGTAIGDAVITSSSILLNSNKSRSIILVTDGRNNVGTPVNESISFATSHNTSVNTIGIGSTNNTEEVVDVSGLNGSTTDYPNLDVEELSSLANQTGGKFVTVTNRSSLEEALLKISTSENRRDISSYLIILGAILLLLEWLLGTTRFSVIP